MGLDAGEIYRANGVRVGREERESGGRGGRDGLAGRRESGGRGWRDGRDRF